MSQTSCPKCGQKTNELVNIDQALLLKLQESGLNEAIPDSVCESCFAKLAGSVARGSVLMARERAKEQKRMMLWKSRVGLIKTARHYMNDKMFSDAAVTYEKYLRVLEVVFDAPQGGLTPEHFKESARTQELTVVASVYWDLVRIYDSSDKFRDRQALAAKKLTEFIKFTPIFPDVIRKAESFVKSAKNPNIIKNFIREADQKKGRCFIATAAFCSPYAPEVQILCRFRDETLSASIYGRVFIKIYYFLSPSLALILDKLPRLKPLVRSLLRHFIALTGRDTP